MKSASLSTAPSLSSASCLLSLAYARFERAQRVDSGPAVAPQKVE